MLIGCLSLQASIVSYTGNNTLTDLSQSFPDAAAADASFQNALTPGGFNTIDFENLPVGSSHTVQALPDVSIRWKNQEFDTIRSDSDLSLGFNTTPGGTNFLSLDSANTDRRVAATFTFSNPIDAFGAYFSGAGNSDGGVFIRFDDGTTERLRVVRPNSTDPGYVGFFGFTDFGKSISSVTLRVGIRGGSSDDIIGVDDIRFQTITPEPGMLGALGLGLLSTVGLIYRRWKA
jgi:hypothetical protein